MTNKSTTEKMRTSLYIDVALHDAFLETLSIGVDKSANAAICKLIEDHIKQHERRKAAAVNEWTSSDNNETTYNR